MTKAFVHSSIFQWGGFSNGKGSTLYEGKAKRIYATDDEDVVWVEYKDSATAFNGEKKAK